MTLPPAVEPVLDGKSFARLWRGFVSRVTSILTGREPLRVASYTVAGLPPAADWPRCVVIVTDEADGEVPAWSDGTVWRRVTDRAEVTI